MAVKNIESIAMYSTNFITCIVKVMVLERVSESKSVDVQIVRRLRICKSLILFGG